VLDEKVIDTPVNNFSSTGFNSALIPKKDESLHATSRRYGKSTNYRTAVNFHPLDYSTTTTRASFNSPAALPRANWRSRDIDVRFDNSHVLKIKE